MEKEDKKKEAKPLSFTDLSAGQINKILKEEAKSNKAIEKDLKEAADEMRKEVTLLLLGTQLAFAPSRYITHPCSLDYHICTHTHIFFPHVHNVCRLISALVVILAQVTETIWIASALSLCAVLAAWKFPLVDIYIC